MIKYHNGRVHLLSLDLINTMACMTYPLDGQGKYTCLSLNILQALLKCFSYKKKISNDRTLKNNYNHACFPSTQKKLFRFLEGKDQMVKVLKSSYVVVRKYLTSLCYQNST